MLKPFHALFLFLAQATHDELIRQIQYLKVENEILRSKLPKRIAVTPAERFRLLKFGRLIGPGIKHLISIVHPRTFSRWLVDERKGGKAKLSTKRGRGTWDEFVKRHAKTLYACDFMSVRSWTCRGRVDMYLLLFIHIESRRVFMSHATAHPNAQWVEQQARNFCIELDEQEMSITHFSRDRDSKFTEMFDTIIRSQGAERCLLPIRSPNLNAYASCCTLLAA